MMGLQDDVPKVEEVKEAQKASRSHEDVQSDKSEMYVGYISTRKFLYFRWERNCQISIFLYDIYAVYLSG